MPLGESESIRAIMNGYPLGFVISRLSSEEQVALISSLSDNITSIIKSRYQLTHVFSHLSPEGKSALFTALMRHSSEIVHASKGLTLEDLEEVFHEALHHTRINHVNAFKTVLDTIQNRSVENTGKARGPH